MLRILSRNFQAGPRFLSNTAVQRMPFAKHEIVPDVIPVAPSNVAKVNYVSGGN